MTQTSFEKDAAEYKTPMVSMEWTGMFEKRLVGTGWELGSGWVGVWV